MKLLNPSEINLPVEIANIMKKSFFFMALDPQAGTTSCSRSFAEYLASYNGSNVLLISNEIKDVAITQHSENNSFYSLVNSSDVYQTAKQLTFYKQGAINVLARGKSMATAHHRANSIETSLSALMAKMDYIVYDGSAFSESKEYLALATEFDSVVLVLESNITRMPVAKNALKKLKQAGINVGSAVYNRREYPIPESIYKLL